MRHSTPLTIAITMLALLALTGCIPSPPVSGTGDTTPQVTAAAASSVMPDVVGKDFDTASSELSALNARITKVHRIDPKPAGTVISQDPVAGATIEESVTLTVSVAPLEVPDVTASSFGDAQTKLQELGFTVTENPVFDDKLTDGYIIKQDPPAGATNIKEVRLNVARRPAVTYLSDEVPVSKSKSGEITTGQKKTNGTTYTRSLEASLRSFYSSDNSMEFGYDLSRKYRQLVGTVGLSDNSPTSATARVELFGDGRPLKEYTLSFGKPETIDIDVTKVLRLSISISGLSNDEQTSVIFGDPRLQGLQAEVNQPETAPTPEPGSPTQ